MAEGLEIASVGADEERNAVIVGAANASEQWQQRLTALYGPNVKLVQEQLPQAQASQERIFWPIPPVFGGLHIFSEEDSCSSAFSARRGKVYRLLTAGHCGGRGVVFKHFVGGSFRARTIGPIVARTWHNGAHGDFALMRMKRRFGTRRLLVHPRAQSGRQRYLRIDRVARFASGDIKNRQHQGTRICKVGYQHTPLKCGRLVRTDETIAQRDRATGTVRIIRHQHRASYASMSGDSGGAVFAPRRRGLTTAYGVHHSSGSRGATFTPISTILRKYRVTIVGVR